jgi:hypothetical protein
MSVYEDLLLSTAFNKSTWHLSFPIDELWRKYNFPTKDTKDQGITAQATVKSQAFILFTHTLSIGFPQFSFVLLQDES